MKKIIYFIGQITIPGLPNAFSSQLRSMAFPLFLLSFGFLNQPFQFLNSKPYALFSLIFLMTLWLLFFVFYSITHKHVQKTRHYSITISFAFVLCWGLFWSGLLFLRPFWLGVDIYQVQGNSMLPTLRPGEIIVIDTNVSVAAPGDIVVVQTDFMNKAIVKRVADMPAQYNEQEGYLWLLGDNPKHSTDSRTMGRFPVSSLQGRLIWLF